MEYDELKQWFIEKKKLFFASIELTQKCNFQCKHCFCPEKDVAPLSVTLQREIIDKIHSTGCLFLNMTGGEILGYEHFLDLYCYAKEKGFIIDLMTNGSLLNNEHIAVFKKLPPSNISITLYGTSEDEYRRFTGTGNNFIKVMNSLQLLKENHIPFALRAVATKTTRESLQNGRFDRIADSLGVPFRYDPIIFPKISGDVAPLKECMEPDQIVDLERCTGLRKVAWETKIEEANNKNGFAWHCHAGENSIFVDCKGNAYLCGIYRNNPISIVNNGIDVVLGHLRQLHQRHTEIVATNECSACKMRKICKWCPAYSQLYNGTEADKVLFFCELSAARTRIFGKKVEFGSGGEET